MKHILLASTALVAFAGAAAAEISFSGSATLGYNNHDNPAAAGDNDGFYTDLDLDLSFSQELDNGLTASATVSFDNLNTGAIAVSGTVISLVGGDYGLYYGDTALAADNVWSSVGSMDADTFRTEDGEDVLRGEMTFGDIAAQVSVGSDASDDAFMSFGATASFGSVDVLVAYQEANTATLDLDDNGAATQDSVLGLTLSTTLGGADVAVGYAKNDTIDSTGISVSYPVGDSVTLTASYVSESTGNDNWDLGVAYSAGSISVDVTTDESDDWGIEGSYDMGNGMVLFAGIDDAGDDSYAAVTYDLGGGASLLASVATDSDNDNADDEIGAGDYQEGFTVELSFSF